jgi:hypothetical protein
MAIGPPYVGADGNRPALLEENLFRVMLAVPVDDFLDFG